MEIVKGVMAAQAMKHEMGRVVKKFPPQVRVTKKDKKRLQEIVSEMSRASAARRNGHANGHADHILDGRAAFENPENVVTPPAPRLLTDEHALFFKRIAEDVRLPKDIRSEAFGYLLNCE